MYSPWYMLLFTIPFICCVCFVTTSAYICLAKCYIYARYVPVLSTYWSLCPGKITDLLLKLVLLPDPFLGINTHLPEGILKALTLKILVDLRHILG